MAMQHMIFRDQPLNIILVEDSKGDALLITKMLDQAMTQGYQLVIAQSLAEAVLMLSKDSFHVALLDRSLPDVEGFDGLHAIQNIAPELPIIFLTAYKDELLAFEAIQLGAQDYLFKDAINAHMMQKAIYYSILRKEFEELLFTRANYDTLTGLANRMLFENRLDIALAQMKRHQSNVSVLFLDLDHFKEVNDHLGHAAGDELLKQAGERLSSCLRPYDTAARFGGDEFAVLLQHMPKTGHSEAVARKIIALFDKPFILCGKVEVQVGVSVGIANCTNHDITIESLMQRADEAMYEAKLHKGNGYCCQDEKRDYCWNA